MSTRGGYSGLYMTGMIEWGWNKNTPPPQKKIPCQLNPNLPGGANFNITHGMLVLFIHHTIKTLRPSQGTLVHL